MKTKSSNAQIKAAARYSRSHTKRYAIELNLKTDADIISYLDGCENKQGAIKQALREMMKK